MRCRGMREQIALALERGDDAENVVATLARDIGGVDRPASQLVEYLASAHAALGVLPTQSRIVLERFFDESGGMQLVIHSPYGSRINRAWGLALRKRFCVKFDFELQAAATEDAIVLSLSTSHSFLLEDVARYLHSSSVRDVLIQAMLAAPMFAARWRWVAGTSLALPRFRGGKKVPAPLQRMRAEDLMASVFPDQIACAENLTGPREVPDHPLVNQAVHDCLHEAMDIDGLERVLRGIESGAIEVVARDLTHPSPLALEILTARPYAYLDDAPLEERRTQAVMARRWLDEASAADLGRLDVAAIERVRAEAWPEAVNADEMHDALLGLGFVTERGSAIARRLARVSRGACDGAPRDAHRRARPSRERTAVGRRRKIAAIRSAVSERAATTGDRCARGIHATHLGTGRGADRGRAQPTRSAGSGDNGRARLDPRDCRDGNRDGARQACGRGRRHAGRVYPRRHG